MAIVDDDRSIGLVHDHCDSSFLIFKILLIFSNLPLLGLPNLIQLRMAMNRLTAYEFINWNAPPPHFRLCLSVCSFVIHLSDSSLHF
jgi:hypothetical protein